MARSAEDFINDAKNRVNNRRFFELPETVSTDDDSSNGRDASAWGGVFQTNAGYDGATSESGSNDGSGYESNNIVARTGGSTFETERDSERGILDEYSSSNRTYDDDSGYDIPVRNYQSGSGQPVLSVPGQSTRVIKKRTSFFDNIADAVKQKIPRTNSTTKKSTLTKVAGVTRKLLTLQEMTHNRPILIKTVLWTSDHLDYGLEAITKGHRPVEIWSNLEYADAEILVDAFLEMGQKSERWAMAVRQVMDYEKRVQLGVILIPRAVKSIVHLFTYGIDIRVQA